MNNPKNDIRGGDLGYLSTHYLDMGQILLAMTDAAAKAELNGKKLTISRIAAELERYEAAEIKPQTVSEVSTAFTASREKRTEPIILNSGIGIDRYYCMACKKIVDKHDKYCRHCGRKFTEEVE